MLCDYNGNEIYRNQIAQPEDFQNVRGVFVAGEVGFEPTTPNLGGWCSVRHHGENTHDP